MVSLPKKPSFPELQDIIFKIYGLPDDRLYSLPDLISNVQRFMMRALKGVRKSDIDKTTINLLIGLSWLSAVSNRMHIDIDKILWKRFPDVCSYCQKNICECKKEKVKRRKTSHPIIKNKPQSISQYQEMFQRIYPPKSRGVYEAGVHLAEETGELTEAVHIFLGEHRQGQFKALEDEIADTISCIFGVANSINIDISTKLVKMYSKNCHECHKAPCECSFSHVSKYKS